MATKTIIKDVVIRDVNLAKNLIIALEQAENKGRISVKYSKPVNNITRDQVKLLFGERIDEGL
jgi:hypothetical protein